MNDGEDALVTRLRGRHAARDTKNFGVLDFVHAFGSPVDALMYARLFWPKFAIYRDVVLLDDVVRGAASRHQVDEAIARYKWDLGIVEETFNVLGIPAALIGPEGGATEAEDESLQTYLVEMWTARLAVQFPERRFEVKAVPREWLGGECGIVFRTVRGPDGEQQIVPPAKVEVGPLIMEPEPGKAPGARLTVTRPARPDEVPGGESAGA